MAQESSNQLRNKNTNPQSIPDDVIGELVIQAQNLTRPIPEIELEENLKDAVIAGTTKLVGKILSNLHIQKSLVLNVVNKAWNLQGDVVIYSMDRYQNIYSFSFIIPADRDQIWHTRIWHVNNSLLFLK